MLDIRRDPWIKSPKSASSTFRCLYLSSVLLETEHFSKVGDEQDYHRISKGQYGI